VVVAIAASVVPAGEGNACRLDREEKVFRGVFYDAGGCGASVVGREAINPGDVAQTQVAAITCLFFSCLPV
jgi:hypothetical protein